MKSKTVIASILKTEGVDYLTCFPHNQLIDAATLANIRPIVARTERVALNIADGYSRISNGRKIGVCAVQHGPGAENAFGGIAQAYSDNTPLLFLPTGPERSRLGVAPSFQSPHSYQNVTKWAATTIVARDIPIHMRRAFTLLRSGKMGPVLLEIPRDVIEEDIGEPAWEYTPVKVSKTIGDPKDVAEAVQVLLSAKTPVILVGQGIFYAEAWDELKELAELVQAPVMTTLNGKSAFPENHPLSLGTGGSSRPKTVDYFLRKADVVFGVGTSFTRSLWITPIPPGKTMVQITNSELDVNKDYPISYGVIGDAKAVLGQILAEVIRQLGPNGRRGQNAALIEEIKSVKDEFLRAWMPRIESTALPISPYRVIWSLMCTVDRSNTVVTHDAGSPRDQVVPFYETVAPRGYIGWGKSTQLGTGMGLAMGAKLAAPGKLCINIMGDAAFGMVGMDFETAVRSKIPILTVVMNNGLMGGYDKFIPVSTERYGSRFLSGNYSKVADALGGYTERVEKLEDLIPAIKRSVRETEVGRAALLEVMTREDSVFPEG